MARKFDTSLDLHTIVEKGFPISALDRLALEHDDKSHVIDVVFHITAYGHSGNGWDDPGEPFEYEILKLTCTDALMLVKFTDEQESWIHDHIEDQIRDIVNEPDEPDYDEY